jgi:hypothetical protein
MEPDPSSPGLDADTVPDRSFDDLDPDQVFRALQEAQLTVSGISDFVTFGVRLDVFSDPKLRATQLMRAKLND